MRMQRLWWLGGLVSVIGVASSARADPPPGARLLDANGMFKLNFHFQYIPTDHDLAEAKAQVERARLELCDATDTTVKLKSVKVTIGQGTEEDGEVWLFPASARSNTTALMNGGHVLLFRDGASYTGGTIAHELGHQLFGLGDNYREEPKAWNLCGQGPSFEPGTLTDTANTIMQDSTTTCSLPDGTRLGDLNPNWETLCVNDTGCGTCTACAGLPSPPADPTLSCAPSQPLTSELSVTSNFDRVAGSDAAVCPPPVPASDIVLKASFSGSSTRSRPSTNCGDGIVQAPEQCDPAADPSTLPACTEFGLAEAGDATKVTCDGNCTLSTQRCPGRTIDRCPLTSGLTDACNLDGTVPAGTNCASFGLGGTAGLFCTDCSLVKSNCTAPPQCGDGIVQAPEECDLGARNATVDPARDAAGNLIQCSSFWAGSEGSPGCATNCTLNKNPCGSACPKTAGMRGACTLDAGKPVPPSQCTDIGYPAGETSCERCSLSLFNCGAGLTVPTWEEARRIAAAESGWLPVVDSLGQLHRIDLFAAPVNSKTWTLLAVGQAEDFVGGTPGQPQLLRTFTLTFDTASNAITSVKGGSGPDTPGTTGTLTLGGVPAQGGEGTAAFVPHEGNQAPPLNLTIHFDQVSHAPWLRYSDAPSVPQGPPGFLSGTHVTAAAGNQVAACNDSTQCELWNSMSKGWEGVQQRWDEKYQAPIKQFYNAVTGPVSDWDLLVKVLAFEYGINVDTKVAVVPAAPTEADCGGPLEWDDSAARITAPDGIVLVIDRSGSMSTPIDANADNGTGTGQSRLAFAQGAARDLLDLVADRSPAPQAGLVSFATTATNDQGIVAIGTSGGVTLDQFKSKVNALSADGFTAIGVALDQAGQLFDGTSLMAKTIILLSDGENNRPDPIGNFEPVAVAQRLAAKGIRVFTIPTGHAADKKTLANIAVATGGSSIEAPVGDEIPGIFAEFFALASGETLALPRQSVHVEPSIPCGTSEIPNCIGAQRVQTSFGCLCRPSDGSSPFAKKDIPVEAGADKLNVVVSVQNTRIETWHPQIHLIDPSGNIVLNETDASVRSDPFYRIFTVANPVAGTWSLELAAEDLDDNQIQYVLAHVQSVGPDCYATLSNTVVPDNQPVALTVSTFSGGRIIPGAAVTATLTRPDGSSVPLTLGNAGPGGARSLELSPSLYVGRGYYRVDVSCATSGGEAFGLGEHQLGPEPGDEANRAPAFTRFGSKGFFVDSNVQPAVPGGDCDRNGIPDANEPAGDFDGDGLPDVCDQDDDNDDVPEPGDPDPHSSTCSVPACPIASAGPDQVVECTANGSASVTLDGRASHDPDGTALTYAWTSSVALTNANQSVASGVFPLGTNTVNLSVSDGPNQVSDSALITVVDTTPPVIVLPPDVAAPTCGSVNIGTATATDACGGNVTVTNDAPANFPRAGKTIVTWRAVDRFGNFATAAQTISVGVGNNRNCCPLGTHVIVGTSNNDTLTGTSGSDCIIGLGGQDTLRGLGGNDFLSGGDGDDVLWGGDGDDQLEGGTGQDILQGEAGNDNLLGGDGDDTCHGGIGNDRLQGGQGQDQLFGEDGNDTLLGETGVDHLEGGNGDDLLNGGGPSDTCIGGPGTNKFVQCTTQQ